MKFGTARLFGLNVPSWMLHNPLYLTMQLGATARRTKDYYVKRGKEGGFSEGLWAGALGMAEEVPFINQGIRIDKLFQSKGEREYYLDELAKNTFDPAFLNNIAQWTDTEKDAEGNPVFRKPKGFIQSIESGIPILREKVPVSDDAKTKQKLKDLIYNGDDYSTQLQDAIDKGLVSPSDTTRFINNAKLDPPLREFENLKAEQQLKILSTNPDKFDYFKDHTHSIENFEKLEKSNPEIFKAHTEYIGIIDQLKDKSSEVPNDYIPAQ